MQNTAWRCRRKGSTHLCAGEHSRPCTPLLSPAASLFTPPALAPEPWLPVYEGGQREPFSLSSRVVPLPGNAPLGPGRDQGIAGCLPVGSGRLALLLAKASPMAWAQVTPCACGQADAAQSLEEAEELKQSHVCLPLHRLPQMPCAFPLGSRLGWQGGPGGPSQHAHRPTPGQPSLPPFMPGPPPPPLPPRAPAQI